jgi:hypothetical protein
MQSPQEQITTVADLFKGTGERIVHRRLLKRYSEQRHVARRYGIAQFIDDLVALLRWARMPWLLPMGRDCLRVKFDLGVREILSSDRIDLFIDPIDLALEHRNSAQNKIFVFRAVGVTRLVNVEQVHIFQKAKKNSQAGVNPTSHEERSPT